MKNISLVLLLLLLSNSVHACSFPVGFEREKVVAQSLIVKVTISGPVYTNIKEYTLLYNKKDFTSPCGEVAYYIKKSSKLAGVLIYFGLISSL